MTSDRPPLASGTLDRDAATRVSSEAFEAAWNEAGARVLRVRGSEIPVIRGVDRVAALALVGTTGFEVSSFGDSASVGRVFLGRISGDPVFAVVVDSGSEDAEPQAALAGASGRPAVPGIPGEEWCPVMAAGVELGDTERQLVLVATALLRWHESALFSPRDGGVTRSTHGGWARLDERGGELFPRTDPAVIVLIEHDGRVLLGSNALWESGRFSLLAGFVEAGESLEQAVLREVFEESGVRLGEIAYVTSQPWPFPRSLMLGFRARLAAGADPAELRPEPEEISELRWFTRDELRDPPSGVTLPGPLSIARWMIDRWIEEGEPGGG